MEQTGGQPGRWYGGAVAALLALGVAVVAVATGGWPHDPLDVLGQGGFVGVGLAGIPVAFVLGRALLPAARTAGFLRALGVGVVFALLAPPAGAVVVLGVLLVPGTDSTPDGFEALAAAVILLPYALVFSYVAVVATLPAGLLWGLLVRAIPERDLATLGMPKLVTRLGARHAIVAAVLLWVVVAAARSATDAAR